MAQQGHKTYYTVRRSFSFLKKRVSLLLAVFPICGFSQTACPSNVGVEMGNFTNWQCYAGSVAAVGTSNEVSVAATAPVNGQHQVYSNVGNTSLDAYGLFPEKCPNGSNYSIKLGNNQGGKGAERVSYTFTVPAAAINYSLVYWYAVVFQNPDHQIYQQPRFVANVFDEQASNYISCASFTYVGSSGLPGFEQSTVNRDVVFKKWAPVTVNLSGYAGHTIRLEFTTADCTQGGHFGYAYIDINEQCSQPVQGGAYCAGANTLTVTAPYGYQHYNWYHTGLTQELGTSQILQLTPPPPDGTQLAVVVVPFDGFGCKDTLYTTVKKLPAPTAYAGIDTSICSGAAVTIGQPANTQFFYKWTPATSLVNPQSSYTIASPVVTTLYTLTVSDTTNICTVTDSVLIQVKPLPVVTFNAIAACVNNPVQVDNTTSYTGSGSLQYLWNFGNGTTSTSKTPAPVFTSPGTYRITLKVAADACPDRNVTTSGTVAIVSPPAAKSTQFSTISNEPVSIGTGNSGTDYNWQPPVFLNNYTQANPIFTGTANSKYLVAITTAQGCKVVDTVTVKVEKEATILVPSAFTPNGDGRNDRAFPFLFAIKQLQHFRIWNRWGLLVYESQVDLPGWNGQYKNILQPTGAYVWEAVGLSVTNKVVRKQGLIMLIW